MQPGQMQKLKMAKQWRENPGFEFLMECWADDPASADRDQETGGEVSVLGACGGGWCIGEVG